MRSNKKLVAHNMLTSDIIKGVKNDFPLGIVVSYVELKHVTIYSYLACFHLHVVNIAFTSFYLIIARRSRWLATASGLHRTTSNYMGLHLTASDFIELHRTALNYIRVHRSASDCIRLHRSASDCIKLQSNAVPSVWLITEPLELAEPAGRIGPIDGIVGIVVMEVVFLIQFSSIRLLLQ